MPQVPLSDGFSAVLRSDSSAALAALMVIANAHRDLVTWFLRTIFGGDASAADPEPQPRPKLSRSNTRLPRGGKSPRRNGVHRRGRNGNDAADLRRAKRDADDAALVEAMRVDPRWRPSGLGAVAIGKSRTSVVSQRLHRLGRMRGLSPTRIGFGVLSLTGLRREILRRNGLLR